MYVNVSGDGGKMIFNGCSFMSSLLVGREGGGGGGGEEGEYVYIECKDGKEFVDKSEWGEYGKYEKAKSEGVKKMWIEEWTRDRKKQNASVICFIYAPSVDESIKAMYVKSSGTDEIETCGWRALPCETVDVGLERREKKREVRVLGSGCLSSAYCIQSDAPLYIGSSDDGNGDEEEEWSSSSSMEDGSSYEEVVKAKIEMNKSIQETSLESVLYNEGELNISNIEFSINGSIMCEGMKSFIWSCSYVNVLNVDIVESWNCGFRISLFVVSGGRFVSNGVKILNMKFEGDVFAIELCEMTEVVRIDGWSVNKIECKKSFIKVRGVKEEGEGEGEGEGMRNGMRNGGEGVMEFSLSKSNFSNIGSEGEIDGEIGEASVVSAVEFREIRMSVSECGFVNMSNEKSVCGGAMHVSVKKNGYLSIVNNSYAEKCICNRSEGRGGFLYVDLIEAELLRKNGGDVDKVFTLSKVGFKNNDAYIGRDVYIRCENGSSVKEWGMIEELEYELLDLKNAIYGGDGGMKEYGSEIGMSLESESMDENEEGGRDEDEDEDDEEEEEEWIEWGSEGNEIDLVPFFYNYTSEHIYVDGKGSGSENTANCGGERKRCVTLSYGGSHVKAGSESELLFYEGSVLGGELCINEFKMRPVEERGRVSVKVSKGEQKKEGKEEGMIRVNKSGSIERVIFEIGSVAKGCSHEAFIVAENVEDLIVSECSFKPGGSGKGVYLCHPLVYGKNSVIILREVEVSKFCLSSSGMCVGVDECGMTFSSCKVKDIILVESSVFESLNKNLMSNLMMGRRSMNEMSFNWSMRIVNCEFENISSYSEKKPCIMQMENGLYELSVECSLFKKTGSRWKEGKTMWIGCKCNMENVTFSEIGGGDDEEDEEWVRRGKNRLGLGLGLGLGLKNSGNGKKNVDEEKKSMCEWVGGAVVVSGLEGVCRMSETNFSYIRSGGLRVEKNGSVKLEDCGFENNDPGDDVFISMRRNVVCEGGSIEVVSLKETEDSKAEGGLWMRSSLCNVTGCVNQSERSLFFVAVLKYGEMSMKADGLSGDVRVKGEHLLPCNLSVVLSDEKKNVICKSEPTLHPDEYSVVLEMSDKEEMELYEEALNVSVRIATEDNGLTYYSESAQIKTTLSERRVRTVKSHASLYIPLIAGLIVGLILVSLIVIVCCVWFGKRGNDERKKKRKEDEENEEERVDTLQELIGPKEVEMMPALSVADVVADVLRLGDEEEEDEDMNDEGEVEDGLVGRREEEMDAFNFSFDLCDWKLVTSVMCIILCSIRRGYNVKI